MAERRKRPPPPLSMPMLEQAASRHLQRYWPSAARMKEVLMRRVDKCVAWHGGSRAEGERMAEAVVARLVETGALNDARFTRAWLDTLQRRGCSRAHIRQHLRQKGVAPALIDEALAELQAEPGDDELARACAYARRRRLGPMRTDPQIRADRRQRDLAAMARAGFPIGICFKVIGAEDLDALEAAAGGQQR